MKEFCKPVMASLLSVGFLFSSIGAQAASSSGDDHKGTSPTPTSSTGNLPIVGTPTQTTEIVPVHLVAKLTTVNAAPVLTVTAPITAATSSSSSSEQEDEHVSAGAGQLDYVNRSYPNGQVKQTLKGSFTVNVTGTNVATPIATMTFTRTNATTPYAVCDLTTPAVKKRKEHQQTTAVLRVGVNLTLKSDGTVASGPTSCYASGNNQSTLTNPTKIIPAIQAGDTVAIKATDGSTALGSLSGTF